MANTKKKTEKSLQPKPTTALGTLALAAAPLVPRTPVAPVPAPPPPPPPPTTLELLWWHLQMPPPVQSDCLLDQLVPGAELLRRSVNVWWKLPEARSFRPGEIPLTWTVKKLADAIDKKLA
jgi:hypothetical protein